MRLLEPLNCPAKFDRILVACKHHTNGRKVLVKDIINSKNCCHKGNAQSESGRKQRSATLSKIWDNSETRIPLLRNTCGHKGSDKTKIYICKIKTSDDNEVLKFGRSERGSKRFGRHLVKIIYEKEFPTESAKLIELYAHLRFSEYSIEVELDTSGYTECYDDNLPISQVIEFFESSL